MKHIKPLKLDFKVRSDHFPNGIPRTQSAETPEELVDDSMKVAHLVPDIVRALINTANDDLTELGYRGSIHIKSLKKAPPKTLKRINEKAADEYEGNYTDIRDVDRQSMDLRKPHHLAAFCSAVEWAEKEKVELPHGAYITITENRFKRPTSTGYCSHKANIAIPIPGEPGRHHIVELMTVHGGFEKQIKTDKKNRFGVDSHGAYGIERVLRGKAQNTVLTPDAIKIWRESSKICLQIHARAHRDHQFDEINFESFEHLRTMASYRDLTEHMSNEQS